MRRKLLSELNRSLPIRNFTPNTVRVGRRLRRSSKPHAKMFLSFTAAGRNWNESAPKAKLRSSIVEDVEAARATRPCINGCIGEHECHARRDEGTDVSKKIGRNGHA